MEEVVITKLEREDIDSFSSLLKEAFDVDIVDSQVEKSLDDVNKIYLIAKKGDVVVGNILIDIDNDAIKNIKKFYLGYVCVREDSKGQGIGTRLLRKVEEIAASMNVDTIWFTSSFDKCAAHNLYKKNNYEIKDTAVFIKKINN